MGYMKQILSAVCALSLVVIVAGYAEPREAAANTGSQEYLIMRNDTETDILPNVGSVLNSTWDTEVSTLGTSITYSAGEFQLDIGKYLVMYSERWDTADTTNNTRVEIQGRVFFNNATSSVGAAQCFIRKSSGQQECIVAGAGIFDVTSDNTPLEILFYGTQDHNTGLPSRVPDWGGVQIIKLPNDLNYARYSRDTTVAANTSQSVWADVTWESNDEEDAGFSRSGADITITNAGRYLYAYSMPISHTSASSRTEYNARITLDDVEVTGTRGSTYMRGSDGARDGVLNSVGIIDVATNDVLTVENLERAGTASTFGSEINLQLVQLPSDAKTFIREATTGDHNPSTLTEFAWDTNPYIDTDTFTVTSVTDTVTEVDVAGDYLFFFNQASNDSAGSQRMYPTGRLSVDDVIVTYMADGTYIRNSGTADDGAVKGGVFVPNMTVGQNVSVENIALGASGTGEVDFGAFSGLRMDTLFVESDGGPVDVEFYINQGRMKIDNGRILIQ